MTRKTYCTLSIATLAIALAALLFSCKKDNDPNIQSITFEREYFSYTPTAVTVTGVYAYDGKINGIKMQVGKRNDLVDARAFNADIDGKDYTVEITGLQPGAEYHYCYEVDYGFSKPYKTETKTFVTPADSPVVKTLEVMVLDSTTVRVKCEVVAEGGQEVTERGICFNTYGDPTLDDETMQHAIGGVGQYTLRLEGLALSTKYYVRAYAKNASGIGFGEVLEFETLAEALLPEVSTVEVSNVTSTSATCMGNVASDGGLELTERGVCWSLSTNPTTSDNHATATDVTLGVFEVAMTGLTPNKTYHVRAYATNAKGTAYGDDLTFTTTEGLPVVTTSGITEITATSAKGGGEVTDQGASSVTERGICWGTSHNPMISGTHASSGTGIGSYTVSMTNLTPNATYYVRAYATNSQGTAYGAEVSFTALEGLPVVVTLDVTDITSTTAMGHGKVSEQGGSAVTERGICWSTSPSPTTSGNHANSGTGTGEYTVSISNLTPGTKYYVRAYVTNSQGTTYGEQKDFTTAATLPTVVTGNISGTTAHGEVTDAGGAIVTERGICWGTSHNPTTAGTHGSSGTGTGSFSVELTNLAPGTTYYVRAYATNSAGTAYGSEKTLTTDANLPTVTTGEVSNITQTTARGSGNVTNEGGAEVTERGVCWSTSHNPTISGSHANSGTGAGSFTVNMTGLTANTHYYVRAYAKNSAGVSYGNEVDFTTAQNVSAPTVTTSQVTNVQQATATGGGNVTNSGGATVTARGICWSTSHNPTTSGSHANSGTGTGSFTVNMTGLTPNTTYYVRAYAINSAGTSYGSEVSFTTQQALTVPTVTTSQVTNIQQTSATGGGNVTNSGGANVTERGICWGTSHDPTTSGSHASNGTGIGSYTVNMSGLSPGTTYYVRAYAINSQGTAYGSEVTFTTAAGLPTVTTSQVTNITQTSATGGGNVTNSGGATVTERGICWSTSHNPTTSGSHANSGTGTGSFTVNMTGLTANTTYYVRAYAINSAGTSYGSEVSFTTQQAITLPTVSTSQVTNITQTSATGGGNVTATGGANVTERGICWSTNHNPTTSGSHANSGTGTGSFTVNMTGLTANTTYYVRAYAINSAGTSYGSEVSFTTQQALTVPTVTTSQVTNITQTSATGGGNVTATGGGNVTERGICWGTSHNPTTSNSHANSGTGTGSYTVNMTSLTANTTYYVRAYAINSAGTAYGSEVSFTTSDIPNYTIAVSANPSSGGTVSGGGTYQQGQSCTVTASANTGYTFLRWTENGSQVSTNADYTFTVSGNRTLVAQFQAQSYTISVSANPSNGGSVNGGGNYNYGQSCTVVASANSGYEFTNWTEGGSVVSSNASYSFTVSGNRTLVANFETSVPIGAINGLFTINANGDQVYFSQGNLQYIGSASTPYWKFADNQWDYLGDNGQFSEEHGVDRDLFCWATSGFNHGAVCYQPWSTNGDANNYYAYGSLSFNLYDQTGQADWGYNDISNGGNAINQWRTLTKDEWIYVFTVRSNVSGVRYAKAKVNDVKGVILLPDNWSTNYYSLVNTNNGNASFNSNTITESIWLNSFESHGAVFLPAAGYRDGVNGGPGPYSAGFYWSSSSYGGQPYAYGLAFTESVLNDDSYGSRGAGQSVRLIKACNH